PPVSGNCHVEQASADTASLAVGKAVWLVVVKGKPKHTVLGYAILPGGLDLGLDLVTRGDGTVRPNQPPFDQVAAYLNAQAAPRPGLLGIWSCAGPSNAAPGDNGRGHDKQGKSGKS